MSTIVFFHAHPDDEASQTSGMMRLASDAGHRVVAVFATNGDFGEVPDDLAPGETLLDRRKTEAAASAKATGTARIAWLGYADSGMTGWEQNSAPGAFANAPLDEAAARLAAILDEEDADVLVGYDSHGLYGHPDHVKVHPVTNRAAELAARRPRVMYETGNRDHMRALQAEFAERGLDTGFPILADGPCDDSGPWGTPEAELHWTVDVRPVLDAKRAALRAHGSQVSDIGMFRDMPVEFFERGFGQECLIEPGREPGMQTAWPFGQA